MRKRKKIHSILVVAGIVCLAGAVFHIVDTGRIFQKQTIIWSKEQKGSYVQAAKKAPVYFADQTFKKRIQQEIDGVADKQKSGKAYYVSPKGNDNAKGSKKKPFRTFKRACKSLKPGDTLYVRGGIYTENIRLGKKQSGTKKKYVTICNYPGEEPVISGKKKKAKLMKITGASYLRISGLEFQDAKGQDSCGIKIAPGSHHIVISGNKIHQISVPDPKKEDHCANGILLFGEKAKKEIHNILIYNNNLYDCQTGWAECISVAANCRNINVISNRIKNTGNIGIDVTGNYGYCSDPAKDFPRKCLIYQNRVEQCVSPYATSYGIYVDGAKEVQILKYQVRKCSGGIEIGAEEKPPKEEYSTSDILVQDNRIVDNIENGITVGGYQKNLGWVKNVQILNNRCKNNGKDNAILTLAKCKNITLKQNTFQNTSGDAAVVYAEFPEKYTKNIQFQNNKYYNGHSKNKTLFVYRGKTYTSFSKWKKVVGKQAGVYQK